MYNYLTSPLSWIVYLGIFAGPELSFCSSLACLDGSGSTPSRLPTAAEWNSRLSVPQAKPLSFPSHLILVEVLVGGFTF